MKSQYQILGKDGLLEYTDKYSIPLDDDIKSQIANFDQISMKKLRNNSNKLLATDEAIDLLSKILLYDHGVYYRVNLSRADYLPVKH